MGNKIRQHGRLPRLPRRLGERAQSTVEFAIILPALFLLAFMIIDFGRAFDDWITVTSSVREGARVGAVGADTATIIDKVNQAAGGLSPLNVTVQNVQGAPGQTVSVSASYDFSFVTPIGPLLQLIGGGGIPNGFTMSSTAKMRLE